jgi:hypothetical protein
MHSFHAAVNTADATLDAAKSDLYPSLRDDWLGHERTIDTLLSTELASFNKKLAALGVSPVVVGDR